MGFQAIGFDDFAKELDRLGKLDEYAPDMLEAAAPILERELKGQVQAEANRGYATGDLAGSIKSRKPEKNERGHYVTITASGKDKKVFAGMRNWHISITEQRNSRQDRLFPKQYKMQKENVWKRCRGNLMR